MTTLLQLLRDLGKHPLPGDRVKIVGHPVNRELLGQTGILKRYAGVYVEINGQQHYLSTNSIKLED